MHVRPFDRLMVNGFAMAGNDASTAAIQNKDFRFIVLPPRIIL